MLFPSVRLPVRWQFLRQKRHSALQVPGMQILCNPIDPAPKAVARRRLTPLIRMLRLYCIIIFLVTLSKLLTELFFRARILFDLTRYVIHRLMEPEVECPPCPPCVYDSYFDLH
jgi:hypothetical protein